MWGAAVRAGGLQTIGEVRLRLHMTELGMVKVVHKWALYRVTIWCTGVSIYVVGIDGERISSILSGIEVLLDVEIDSKIMTIIWYCRLVGLRTKTI